MDYLLRFPSGRFSELAQFQLDRVLVRKGEKKIALVSDAKNPFTKGTLRLDTNYKVGDLFRYREIDMLTRLELRTYGQRVTTITDSEVIFNDGNRITDFLGNIIQNAQGVRLSGSQFYIPEYSLGKRWSARYQRILPNGRKFDVEYDFRVTTKELTQVPASSFDAFRIEGTGWTQAGFLPRVYAGKAPDGIYEVDVVAQKPTTPGGTTLTSVEVKGDWSKFTDGRVKGVKYISKTNSVVAMLGGAAAPPSK